MKLLSFTVPCYNSAAYMRRCIDSILIGGEEIEIIIVNDGSKDETARIAEEYAEAHPSIVKVIHQENGGLSTARNAGIDCVCVAWGFLGRKKLEALGAERIADNTEQLLEFILK